MLVLQILLCISAVSTTATIQKQLKQKKRRNENPDDLESIFRDLNLGSGSKKQNVLESPKRTVSIPKNTYLLPTSTSKSETKEVVHSASIILKNDSTPHNSKRKRAVKDLEIGLSNIKINSPKKSDVKKVSPTKLPTKETSRRDDPVYLGTTKKVEDLTLFTSDWDKRPMYFDSIEDLFNVIGNKGEMTDSNGEIPESFVLQLKAENIPSTGILLNVCTYPNRIQLRFTKDTLFVQVQKWDSLLRSFSSECASYSHVSTEPIRFESKVKTIKFLWKGRDISIGYHPFYLFQESYKAMRKLDY